jgi:hypothetical protein
LLLPDSSDDIHLERLIRGHFEPAVVAIAAIALLTLLPVTQGIWWAGSQFWGEPFWPASVGRTLWTLLVIGAIIAVIIWAARTNRFSSRADVPGSQTAGGQTAGSKTAGETDARTASAHPSSPGFVAQSTASPTAPTAPKPPATSSSPEDLEAWKRSQAEWKTEHDAWRTKQAADERAVRAQRSAELRAQAREMAAQADEARRRRRLANPRTSGAYVGITIGVAILAGAISAAIAAGSAGQGAASAYAVTIGFAVATLAVGLSIVLAGALRRRSGFLTFISIVLIIVSVATALPPRGRDLVLGYASHNQLSNASIYMPVGAYSVYLDPRTDTFRGTHVIDIDQTIGGVQVTIVRGLTVRVDATQQNNRGSMTATTLTGDESTSQEPARNWLPDGDLRSSITYGSAKTPDVIVRISQWVGSVNVTYDTSRTDQSESTPPPTTSTPSSTAGPTP